MTSDPHTGGGQEPLQRTSLDEGDAKMTVYAPELTDSFEPEVERKWSGRKSLSFIIAASVLLWAVIIAGVVVLL